MKHDSNRRMAFQSHPNINKPTMLPSGTQRVFGEHSCFAQEVIYHTSITRTSRCIQSSFLSFKLSFQNKQSNFLYKSLHLLIAKQVQWKLRQSIVSQRVRPSCIRSLSVYSLSTSTWVVVAFGTSQHCPLPRSDCGAETWLSRGLVTL
jgi:hypothetical protein